MRNWTLIRRLEAATLLPFVLLLSAGPDGTLFRCRHDQRTRLAPCYDAEAAADEEMSVDAADDDVCCDATSLKLVHDSTVSSSTAHADTLVAVLTAPFVPFAGLGLQSSHTATSERTLINTGPPILLKTRSFLN